MSVSETREERFISDGFSNWRNALARFEVHDKSNMHLEAVVKVTAMKQGVNVHTQHNLLAKKISIKARTALCKIVSSLQMLCKQGLAVRGKTDATSTFNKLLAPQSKNVLDLNEWLESPTKYKWISDDIQNEVTALTAFEVMRIIADKTNTFLF